MLIWKGGEDIMALFFAQRVTLGKTKYTEVPSTLKLAVKEILADSGLEFLATEE
jgi:hypothetical protein